MLLSGFVISHSQVCKCIVWVQPHMEVQYPSGVHVASMNFIAAAHMYVSVPE